MKPGHCSVNGGVTMAQYEHGLLRVIDGDTLVISATYVPPPLRPELLLRICGIDTPERGWQADCQYERARADRATAFVQDLLSANNGVTHTIIKKWDGYWETYTLRLQIAFCLKFL